MADCILQQGGSGGITSDEVTASRAHVLKGYYTVTTDSDDEVVEGTIENRGNGPVRPYNEMWWYDRDNGYVLRILAGAYFRVGDYEPYICIPKELIKAAINYKPELTVNTVETCKERGHIPDRGGESSALNAWWENGDLMTSFNEGVYWRMSSDTNDNYRWSPRVRLSGNHLGNANASYVHEGITFTSQHGLRLVGTMREWKPTARDIANAWNNEAVVFDSYDSGYSGRKLLLKVPAWWRIGAVNWVGIDASQYLPQNVRSGVRLPGGLVGTMPHPEPIQSELNNTRNQLNNTTNELNNVRNQLTNTTNELNQYRNSKVAFNFATFDGYLLSGVAEKGCVANGEIFFYNSMND